MTASSAAYSSCRAVSGRRAHGDVCRAQLGVKVRCRHCRGNKATADRVGTAVALAPAAAAAPAERGHRERACCWRHASSNSSVAQLLAGLQHEHKFSETGPAQTARKAYLHRLVEPVPEHSFTHVRERGLTQSQVDLI
jgi:hypothetical protein